MYLILLTNTAHYIPVTIDEHDNGRVQCMHYLGDKFRRLCAVCPDPTWRRRQPAKLDFMVVERTDQAISLMLIERSGPVAYCVQMVDKRVYERPWMDDENHRYIVIGG
jgi:hypothetical protein